MTRWEISTCETEHAADRQIQMSPAQKQDASDALRPTGTCDARSTLVAIGTACWSYVPCLQRSPGGLTGFTVPDRKCPRLHKPLRS